MEINFQITPNKHYRKMQRILSREIYRHNKFSGLLKMGDFLLYLIFLIPMMFISFEIRNWKEILYDWYETSFVCWLGEILCIVSMLTFLYAILLRPYWNARAVQTQVYNSFEWNTHTLRLQEDGLFLRNSLCQTLYDYHQIRHVENICDYLVILIGSGMYVAVPNDAFKDTTQRNEFKALLESKIG